MFRKAIEQSQLIIFMSGMTELQALLGTFFFFVVANPVGIHVNVDSCPHVVLWTISRLLSNLHGCIDGIGRKLKLGFGDTDFMSRFSGSFKRVILLVGLSVNIPQNIGSKLLKQSTGNLQFRAERNSPGFPGWIEFIRACPKISDEVSKGEYFACSVTPVNKQKNFNFISAVNSKVSSKRLICDPEKARKNTVDIWDVLTALMEKNVERLGRLKGSLLLEEKSVQNYLRQVIQGPNTGMVLVLVVVGRFGLIMVLGRLDLLREGPFLINPLTYSAQTWYMFN